MPAPAMGPRMTCVSLFESMGRCALAWSRANHYRRPPPRDALRRVSQSVRKVRKAGSADQSGQGRSAGRSLKRQSQPEPLERSAVFFQVARPIVKRYVVPGGELHELLEWHLAEFSRTSQRDLVLPVEFQY